MSGYNGAIRAALRGVACEPDQVPRLEMFRDQHTDVLIGTDEFGNWQARIPEPDGETIVVRYTLRELLDRLDEVTAEHRGEPDGSSGLKDRARASSPATPPSHARPTLTGRPRPDTALPALPRRTR